MSTVSNLATITTTTERRGESLASSNSRKAVLKKNHLEEWLQKPTKTYQLASQDHLPVHHDHHPPKQLQGLAHIDHCVPHQLYGWQEHPKQQACPEESRDHSSYRNLAVHHDHHPPQQLQGLAHHVPHQLQGRLEHPQQQAWPEESQDHTAAIAIADVQLTWKKLECEMNQETVCRTPPPQEAPPTTT